MTNGSCKRQSGVSGLAAPPHLGTQLAYGLKRAQTCLECGAKLAWVTEAHLASHGMDAETYRAKWEIDPAVSFEP